VRRGASTVEKAIETRTRQQGKKEIMILLQQTGDEFLLLIETIGDVSIYENVAWQEYVCQLAGHPEADYYTDCIEDARNTAQQMRTK